MTYFPITYDKVLNQLIATVNESLEIKVGYSIDDNTISVIKKDSVVSTEDVPYNLAVRDLVNYCFHISKAFEL